MVVMLAAYFHATNRKFRNQSSTFLFLTLFFVFLDSFCPICTHCYSNSSFLCLKAYNLCKKGRTFASVSKRGESENLWNIIKLKRVGRTNLSLKLERL